MTLRTRSLLTVGAAGLVLGVTAVGGGIVYAGQLLPAPARDRTLDVWATVTDRGTVLLPPDRRAYLNQFGLLLDDGGFLVYGGPVVNGGDRSARPATPVERTIQRVVRGTPVHHTPMAARFDEYVFCADPGELGLEFCVVDVPLDTGQSAPAWLVDGSDDWVITVHGRSGSRAESLRVMPILTQAGHSVLAITYRNDQVGGPATTDGVGRFGHTEWADVAAAVQLARRHGARRIVLLGFSQGASLIAYYLRNTDVRADADRQTVNGVIFDSPLLSLSSTLAQQARRRSIPGPLISPVLYGTRIVAGLKAGFDVGDVEHEPFLATTTIPMLLIHGPKDDYVPIGPTDRLAARRPAGLTYERIPGAGHVEGWNTDPTRYAQAVRTFLRSAFAD